MQEGVVVGVGSDGTRVLVVLDPAEVFQEERQDVLEQLGRGEHAFCCDRGFHNSAFDRPYLVEKVLT